jgi:hypothetical protein
MLMRVLILVMITTKNMTINILNYRTIIMTIITSHHGRHRVLNTAIGGWLAAW